MSQTVEIIVEPNIVNVEVITDAFTIVTIKANKNPIPIIPIIDEDFIINWQTDLVENDLLGRTYAERFGNNFALITNDYTTPIGHTKSIVESYTIYSGNLIYTVTIPANILNTGFINIL